MTNKEKFNEVFKETFGYTPEDCFPCPDKCPENMNSCSDACPYAWSAKKEYKKPEESKNAFDFAVETAGMMDDLSSTLKEYSTIKSSELFGLICLFMDVVTDDHFDVDDDLGCVRLEIAEMIYKAWPHSVEYYERKEKKK